MVTKCQSIVIVMAIIGILFIFYSLCSVTQNINNRQYWAAIGIPVYSPKIDPGAFPHPQYSSAISLEQLSSQPKSAGLLNKWYYFSDQLSPDARDTMYALFPDLQTQTSIMNYGVTDRMLYVLDIISPKLNNPQQYKTLSDIQQAFGIDATNILWQETGRKPFDGLYTNWQSYDWGIDVL